MKRPRQERERITTYSENSGSADFTADIHLIDTVNASWHVIDAFITGHHTDRVAVRLAGQAISRAAHRAAVAAANRPGVSDD